MNETDSFNEFILDQLGTLPDLEARRMFGGCGLYAGGVFFGITFRGRCYLKTDNGSRPEFIARGMEPFQPNKKQTLAAYYEVPADVIESRSEFIRWARQALSVAKGDGANQGRR